MLMQVETSFRILGYPGLAIIFFLLAAGGGSHSCSASCSRTNDRVLVHVISTASWRVWAAKESRAMNNEEARALVERQARAWNRADPAAIVADFAPDGVLISPRGRWRGHDALRRAVESVFAAVSDVQVVVTRVLLEADQGAAEWT